MHRQAYRLTGNQDDAEDLVQDLLIRLYERDSNLNDIEKLSSWLLRSLYNQFVDNYRKKNRLPIDDKDSESEEIISNLANESNSPHVLIEKNFTEKHLHTILATLNPDQQALIALHDIEGFSLPELTEILETPVGTLKSRLHRARQALREKLTTTGESITEKPKKSFSKMEPFSKNSRFTG